MTAQPLQPLAIRERDSVAARWRLALVMVAVTLAGSYGYFFSGGGWNQASRFNLVRALVEDGTVQVDRYQGDTGDKAYSDGHFYADKPPGVSLAAVPVVVVAQALMRGVGFEPHSRRGLTALAYLATFFVSGLGTIAAALAMMMFGRRLGVAPAEAAGGALAFGLGTPAWAYATFFWGHAPAAGCLAVAFLLAILPGGSGLAKREIVRGASIGLLGAAAVTFEFPAAGAAGIIGCVALVAAARRGGGGAVLRSAMGMTTGVIPPAVVLLTYQAIAFGSAFRLPYQSVVGFEGMNEGVFGITHPTVTVMGELLFGARKGLIWLAPVVLVAVPGFFLLLKRRLRYVLAAAAIFVYYFLFNASYHYWDGGCCYGPRFLAAGLPFLGVGVMGALSGPRWLRWLTRAATLLSVFLTLAAVAVYSMTPDAILWPFKNLFWPSLRSGSLSLNAASFFDAEPTPAFNLGQLLGLKGSSSLLPLIAFFVACGVFAWWRSQALRRGRSRQMEHLPVLSSEPSQTSSPLGQLTSET